MNVSLVHVEKQIPTNSGVCCLFPTLTIVSAEIDKEAYTCSETIRCSLFIDNTSSDRQYLPVKVKLMQLVSFEAYEKGWRGTKKVFYKQREITTNEGDQVDPRKQSR